MNIKLNNISLSLFISDKLMKSAEEIWIREFLIIINGFFD
jgi:hypothetical protein